MIRWVVGDSFQQPLLVGKFPPESSGDLEKLPQPVSIVKSVHHPEGDMLVADSKQRAKNNYFSSYSEVSWEIHDRDNRVRFAGRPNNETSSPACWFAVKEIVSSETGEIEYHVQPALEWVSFVAKSKEPSTLATTTGSTSSGLELAEKLMKEKLLKERNEFNAYLRTKSRGALEKGIKKEESSFVVMTDDIGASADKKQKVSGNRSIKIPRRNRSDDTNEQQWEGEEAFSDDDDQLFKDEINENEEIPDIDDEDLEQPPEKDEAKAAEDAFGKDIAKIMQAAHAKEKVQEEELDDELKQYADDIEGSEGDQEEAEAKTVGGSTTVRATGTVGGDSKIRPPSEVPTMVLKKTNKEDQIKARIKGLFWRNDYTLKLKDILAQFPGLNRASEEYHFLTKSLKELADVKDGTLSLKPEFRK